MKKTLAFILAAMMMLSATACGKTEENPVEENKPQQEVETPTTTPSTPSKDEKPKEEKPEEPEVEIEIPEQGDKIAEIKAKNNDIIGWLQIPDTDINAAVVQYTNNEFYYRLNELKEYSFTGCYWADYECIIGDTAEDLGRSTVIYGHNTDYIEPVDDKNGDRFSQLFHYTDVDWAKEHPYIYFSTPEEDMMWEVFACAYTSTDFNYIKVLQEKGGEQITEGQMMNIVNEARERSDYDYNDVEVDGDDKILILSTCTYKYGNRKDLRYIVAAKLVTEDDKLVETANISLNTDKKAVS